MVTRNGQGALGRPSGIVPCYKLWIFISCILNTSSVKIIWQRRLWLGKECATLSFLEARHGESVFSVRVVLVAA